MSERFSGGFITKTPVTPTSTSASGIWTLDQQEQAQKAGNWPQQPFNYIEDVFSTYLYTGNSSTQTITNGIDATGKGALTWLKCRSRSATNHFLWDTVNGPSKRLFSNLTNGGSNWTGYLDNTSSGFTVTSDGTVNGPNYSGDTYASWTFRKQPKFFDIVTYTGNGGYQVIGHNLGSVPGCIIIKRTDAAGDWGVWHRSAGASGGDGALLLNTTAARYGAGIAFSVSSTTFSVFNSDFPMLNSINGATYVAYVFAHDAGGFGLTGTDNVISCGSFTTDATTGAATVNLGWEPQWILTKMSNGLSNWTLFDNMRGMSLTNSQELSANASSGESSPGSADIFPSATGFSVDYLSGSGQFGKNKNIIYIAIRRGPMKVPTDATKVFIPGRGTDATSAFITTGFPSDLSIQRWMGSADNNLFSDRLRGFALTNTTASPYVVSNTTGAEVSATATNFNYTNTGFQVGSNNGGNWWALNFRRAPSFFDEVCYTGNGAASRAVPHNLTVAPELIIVKARNLAQDWYVYNGAKPPFYLTLNTINSESDGFNIWGGTATATNFYVNNIGSTVNDSGYNFVAYLFATCLGVSKVGSYTGTGTLTTINCGFTGGARYVLIKRTNASGGWYVWDTARGMVSGTDPSLRLNSTAAEVNANSIYTTATGFQLLASPAADVNTNGGSYIYLAIA